MRDFQDPFHGGKTRSVSATLMLPSEAETLAYLNHQRQQLQLYYNNRVLALVIVGAETAPTSDKPHVHLALYAGEACGGPRSSSWFQSIIHPYIMAHFSLQNHEPRQEYDYIHERIEQGTVPHRRCE